MLDKENPDECLNSLRVASKHWPGFVHYQGLTTKTVLCSLDTSTPSRQRANKSKLARTSHTMCKPRVSQHPAGPGVKLDTTNGHDRASSVRRADTATLNTAQDDANDDDNENESPSLHPRIASLKSKSGSVESATSVCSTTSTNCNSTKACLPLPSVSCNELPSNDDGETCELANHKSVKMTSYAMFSINGQIPSRPHTAGPRMIIPPKHTCPEGLTSNDFIQGQGFNPDKRPHTSYGETSQTKDSKSSDTIVPSCFHSVQRHRYSMYSNTEQCQNPSDEGESSLCSRRPELAQGFRALRRPLTRSSAVEERVVSLELTITAISPSCRSNGEPDDDDDDDDIKQNPVTPQQSLLAENEPRPKTRNGPNLDILSPPSARFDTIEGIKKSYQRAHSAPPTHGRNPISGGSSSEQNGNSDVKQFSNLYYRAKSAYHKRQEPAPTETVDGNKDRSQTPSALKGSLLRPLLCANDQGPMRHGAGCPYKCKGCFKACLVSQDYVQKAVERTLQEQRQSHRQARAQSASAKRANLSAPLVNKRFASVNIVSRALGRSQPLFHQVYGRASGKDGRKISMKPWPRYGWVDLTARKQGLDNLSPNQVESEKTNSDSDKIEEI